MQRTAKQKQQKQTEQVRFLAIAQPQTANPKKLLHQIFINKLEKLGFQTPVLSDTSKN